MAKKYDDEDDGPGQSGEMGGLDKFYSTTHPALLVLFTLCCGCVSLIVNLIAFFTCKVPLAKQRAKTMLLITVALVVAEMVIAVIASVIMTMMGPAVQKF